MIYLIQHRYTEYLNNKLEPKKESLSTFQHSLLNRRFNSHSHDSCWEQEEGALYSNNSLLKTSNEIINILANIFAMVHKPWSHTNQSLETNRLRLIKIQYNWYRVAFGLLLSLPNHVINILIWCRVCIENSYISPTYNKDWSDWSTTKLKSYRHNPGRWHQIPSTGTHHT